MSRGSNDRGLDVIQLNNAGIRLATGFNSGVLKDIELITNNHNFVIEQTSFKIGKLVGTDHPYETIPECIFPLLHDLNYTNNISVQDGGYWNGNAGSTDSRNIQRFTSIIPVDDNYSYIEFKKERIATLSYLGNSFNIKTFSRRSVNNYDALFNINGEGLTLQSNKKDGINPTSIQLSFNESSGLLISFITSGLYINFDETGITFTDSNTQTILSKTWQQLLS